MEPKSVIQAFYTAFQQKNIDEMLKHYHDDIQFEDPAFGPLKGKDAKDMWSMLLARGGEELSIEFGDIREENDWAFAKWIAKYPFGPKKRKVVNHISAKMKIVDGKIVEHKDEFDIWKWSSMALGPIGTFLGFMPMVKNSIRKRSLGFLRKYQAKNA